MGVHEEGERSIKENEVMLNMARRMSSLEQKLTEVQNRLNTAVKEIAGKDEQLNRLKLQVIYPLVIAVIPGHPQQKRLGIKMVQAGIRKVSQPKDKGLVDASHHLYLTIPTDDELQDEDQDDYEYKIRKPKPKHRQFNKKNQFSDFPDVKKEEYLENVHNTHKEKFGDKKMVERRKIVSPLESENNMIKLSPTAENNSTKLKYSDVPSFNTLETDVANSSQASAEFLLEDYNTDRESLSGSISEYKDKTSQEMEEECLQFMKQIEEMEDFLADYGLIWVGSTEIKDKDNNYKNVQTSIGFSPNFDKVIMIICELNDIISSESHVEVSEKKGKFKKADVLKLTLYADGIQLEDNPFRQYSTESVQEFFRDLEDGYYPTELKPYYPDGVIFKVVDKRTKTYAEAEKSNTNIFTGEGHRLGNVEEGERKIFPYPGLSGKKYDKGSMVPFEESDVKKEKRTEVDNIKELGKWKLEAEEKYQNEPEHTGVAQQAERLYKDKESANASKSATSQNIYEEICQVDTSKVYKEMASDHKRDDMIKHPGYRDYINITNITYNEAPITLSNDSRKRVEHYEDGLQGTDCRCPASAVQGERAAALHYKAQTADSQPSCAHGLTDLNNNAIINDKIYCDVKKLPLKGDILEVKLPVAQPSNLSEYSKEYDENTKFIVDEIRRKSLKLQSSTFDVDAQFDHISLLGSKTDNVGDTAKHTNTPPDGKKTIN